MAKRAPATPDEVAAALREMPSSSTRDNWPAHRIRTDDGREAEFVREEYVVRYLSYTLHTHQDKAREWLRAACTAGQVMIWLGEIDGSLAHRMEPLPEGDPDADRYTFQWKADRKLRFTVDTDGFLVEKYGGGMYHQPNARVTWVILPDAYRALAAEQDRETKAKIAEAKAAREVEEAVVREKFGADYDTITDFFTAMNEPMDFDVAVRMRHINDRRLLTITLMDEQVAEFAKLLRATSPKRLT